MTKREFEDTIESAHPGKYFFLTVDHYNASYECYSMTCAYDKSQLDPKQVQILPPISHQRMYMAFYALADDKVLKDRFNIFRDEESQ